MPLVFHPLANFTRPITCSIIVTACTAFTAFTAFTFLRVVVATCHRYRFTAGELGFPKEAPDVHDLKAYRNIARKFGKQSAAEKSGGALDVRKDAAGRAGMAGLIDSRILALMNAGLLSSDEENAALGANEDVRWDPTRHSRLYTQLCTPPCTLLSTLLSPIPNPQPAQPLCLHRRSSSDPCCRRVALSSAVVPPPCPLRCASALSFASSAGHQEVARAGQAAEGGGREDRGGGTQGTCTVTGVV